MKRRIFSCLSALLIIGFGGSALPLMASAADFPLRPVELVVPFGEGSASDIFSRQMVEIVNKSLAQPIYPVNKTGGGGLSALTYAARKKPDGYTLMTITPSHIISDVLGRAGKTTLLGEFDMIARIQSDLYVLCVTKNSKFTTFDELREHALQNDVSFGGISPGALDDLTLNALGDAAGMKIKFVPYKSGAEVKAAVLGGEVEIYLDKLVSAISYIKDGAVRPLVILNDKRIDVAELKNVPCTVEKGIDVTIGSWRGFVLPKGAPQEVRDFWTARLKDAYDSDAYKKFARDTQTDIGPGWLEGDAFRKFLENEYKVFDDVAKKIGLKN